MKKSLISFGMGVGVFLMLPSCQSNHASQGSASYEEAVPMSEYAVADGELPPWLADDSDIPDYLLESGDKGQVSASARTPELRNSYAIPEGDATASTGSSSPTSQNQPNLAANTSPEDDVIVEAETPAFTAPIPSPSTSTATVSGAPAKIATGSATITGTKASSQGKKLVNNKKFRKGKKLDKPTWVTYKVRPGDSLALIAKRSHTTVAQIRKDSGIKGHIIHPGQEIKVRYTPNNYSAKNKKGSTGSKSSVHTVKSGETISGIAKRYGIGTQQLLKANGLNSSQATKIRPGRKLTIPGKNTAKAKTSVKKGKSSTRSKRKR